jgi:hypothetical protein
MSTRLAKIRIVKAAYEKSLMSTANVVGVGIGYRVVGGKQTHQLAIVVMVKKKMPPDALSPEDLIPERIDDVPVDVREVGELKAQ